MTTLSGDDWVSASEAVKILSPHVGGDRDAELLIGDCVRVGRLTASAWYMTEAFDLGSVPRIAKREVRNAIEEKQAKRIYDLKMELAPFDAGFPDVSDVGIGTGFVFSQSERPPRRFDIGGDLIHYSQDWPRDFKRWDWDSGTFVFTRPSGMQGSKLTNIPPRLRSRTRLVIYDVEFKKSDLQALIANFKRKARRKRRPARKHDWVGVLVELVALAYVDGLDKTFNKKLGEDGWQAALEVWISEQFDADDLTYGEQTVRDKARELIAAIWDRKLRGKSIKP